MGQNRAQKYENSFVLSTHFLPLKSNTSKKSYQLKKCLTIPS